MSDISSDPSLSDLATDLLVNVRDQMLRPLHDSIVRENASAARQVHERLSGQLCDMEAAVARAVEVAAARSNAALLSALCNALKQVSWPGSSVTPQRGNRHHE